MPRAKGPIDVLGNRTGCLFDAGPPPLRASEVCRYSISWAIYGMTCAKILPPPIDSATARTGDDTLTTSPLLSTSPHVGIA